MASYSMNTAIVYEEPPTTKTKVVEKPITQPGPGLVLVRLHFSGVCHTDYAFCTGSFPGVPCAPAGLIGGHEGVGVVAARGSEVDLAIGSKVGIKFAADACLCCLECLQGSETSCSKTQISGFTVPGTFQRYCISAARYVTPIPEHMDLASAAPLMCAGVSVFAALKRTAIQAGQRVAVSGAGGGLGHLAIQFAKALGARVIAVDSGDKESFCKDLGADEFLDFKLFASDTEFAGKVKSLSSGGVHVALVCASSTKAYSQALLWLRVRGTMVCLGVPEGDGLLVSDVTVMINSELKIMANKSGNRLEAMECLELASQRGIKTTYTLFPVDSLTKIFEDMEKGKILGRAVLDLR